MYDREKEQELYELRRQAHKLENISNAKRKKQGKAPLRSFPKTEFKLPNDLHSLKTFIIYDELPQLKKMTSVQMLYYCFKNMLIYECNLIFNQNFVLEYNYNSVKVSRSDYRRIFNAKRDTLPKDKSCYKKDDYLYFNFNLQTLKSLNSACAKARANNNTAKSRQYILFNFFILLRAFRQDLNHECKDFLLFILERYHWSKTPKITHRLSSVVKACNMSQKQSKQSALNRLNKYFAFLDDIGIMGDNYLQYQFTVEDLKINLPLNLQLNRIDFYD